MTAKTTQSSRPQVEPAPAASPDPDPEQQPWRTPEDATGWRRIYRGTGHPRQVNNSVMLDLTPEQWTWVSQAAEATGLRLHQVLGKLIEDARAAGSATSQAPHSEAAESAPSVPKARTAGRISVGPEGSTDESADAPRPA